MSLRGDIEALTAALHRLSQTQSLSDGSFSNSNHNNNHSGDKDVITAPRESRRVGFRGEMEGTILSDVNISAISHSPEEAVEEMEEEEDEAPPALRDTTAVPVAIPTAPTSPSRVDHVSPGGSRPLRPSGGASSAAPLAYRDLSRQLLGELHRLDALHDGDLTDWTHTRHQLEQQLAERDALIHALRRQLGERRGSSAGVTGGSESGAATVVAGRWTASSERMVGSPLHPSVGNEMLHTPNHHQPKPHEPRQGPHNWFLSSSVERPRRQRREAQQEHRQGHAKQRHVGRQAEVQIWPLRGKEERGVVGRQRSACRACGSFSSTEPSALVDSESRHKGEKMVRRRVTRSCRPKGHATQNTRWDNEDRDLLYGLIVKNAVMEARLGDFRTRLENQEQKLQDVDGFLRESMSPFLEDARRSLS